MRAWFNRAASRISGSAANPAGAASASSRRSESGGLRWLRQPGQANGEMTVRPGRIAQQHAQFVAVAQQPGALAGGKQHALGAAQSD